MSKSKIILFVLGVFLLVSGVVGGAVAWNMHTEARNKAALAQADEGSNGTLGDSTSTDSVHLNSGQGNASGLSVSNGSGATNLGQLTPNDGGSQSNGGASGQSSSSGGSSASNSSSQSPFDPKTFAQYDKYKDKQYTSTLFGDAEKGTGVELGMNMKAAVYYRGWLTNGTLFDQSKTDAKGQMQPFMFTEGAHEVIPGWEQAVAGMKVGGTRLVIVPPVVGYGEQGKGPIPPNSVLIFQIQLVSAQ